MGRKRLGSCTLRHGKAPCRFCAAERARRHRERHSPSPEEIAAHDKTRAVNTYLQRGAISPPMRCDECRSWVGDPRREAVFGPSKGRLTPVFDPAATYREPAWLCPSCRRTLRRTGGIVERHWLWPGHDLPAGRAWFNKEAHAKAIEAARGADVAQQPRVYCETYLLLSGSADRWLVRCRARYGPLTGDRRFDAAWRAYAHAWWARGRSALETDEPIGTAQIEPARPRSLRCSTLARKAAPRFVPPPVRLSTEEQLAALDSAMAQFDARLAEIMSRSLDPRP